MSKIENNVYLSNVVEENSTPPSTGPPPPPLPLAPAQPSQAQASHQMGGITKKPHIGSSEIYANLSMRSKSNTSVSMSSKLTEATAAVIAANRGSIKSSIKKNKKAAAAAAKAASAAGSDAKDKSRQLQSQARESDYYSVNGHIKKTSMPINSPKKDLSTVPSSQSKPVQSQQQASRETGYENSISSQSSVTNTLDTRTELDYNTSSTSSTSNISLSSSSLSSSTSTTANDLYYQRSSVAGFNFTYMLYDIPEEDDEDNQTERDASNCDEILKI